MPLSPPCRASGRWPPRASGASRAAWPARSRSVKGRRVARFPAIPEYRSLTPEALDALELAVREHLRVALRRRGTEYVVVAERLETSGRDDVLAGRLPMTGELLTVRSEEH